MGKANREQIDERYRCLWLFATLLAILVTYLPTFGVLWKRWISDTQYSIAPLVPFVSGFFAWRKWPEIRKLVHQPSNWGLPLIGFGLILHILNLILDVSGGSSMSMVICMVGWCLYFRGRAFVRTLSFPLAYLVFAVPIPGGVLDLAGFPLQLWAAGSTAVVLNLIGIDTVRHGVHLTVCGDEFQVALACSGLSSLVALVGITAIYAHISSLPAAYKWFLFGLAWPIALIANIFRIITIALVGYQWGIEAAMKIYHDWSGPLLFAGTIGLLIIIHRRLEWLNRRRTTHLSS